MRVLLVVGQAAPACVLMIVLLLVQDCAMAVKQAVKGAVNTIAR